MLFIADGAVVAVRTKVLMETEGQTGVHKYCGDTIFGFANERTPEIDEAADVPIAEAFLRAKQNG